MKKGSFIASFVPLIVLMAVGYVVPVASNIVMSMQDDYGTYVGLQNYIDVFTSYYFIDSMLFTLKIALCSTAIAMVIAVVVALCAVLSGVVGFSLASSRLLYAMSRDGVLPSYFSRVDPKRRTPVRALVFVAAMAFIGSFFGRTVLGWFVDLLSLGVLVAYGYTAAAVIFCARRDRSPGWLVLGVLGVVLTTLFLVLFLFPGLGAPTSEESYIILIAWIALGVNFYKPTFD